MMTNMAYRNNVQAKMTIPQYANLTMYATGYHLTVTFRVKESTVPFIKLDCATRWKNDVFYHKGKYYITAALDIPYHKLAQLGEDIEGCVWCYSGQMCRYLKVALREAKIRELEKEVKQLSFDF